MGLLFVTPDVALGVWLSLVPALALAIDRSLGDALLAVGGAWRGFAAGQGVRVVPGVDRAIA